MSLNRREILRFGAIGASGLLLPSAASASALQRAAGPIGDPLLPRAPAQPARALGVDQRLFEKAKAALDIHRATIRHRDVVGIVDFSMASSEPRFHMVDLMNGRTDSFRVSHGRGSDPRHSGFLEHFSNKPGSKATSQGTYSCGATYHGKYGLSMRLHGLDWTNNNAHARAIVLHNAWYAEDEMVSRLGKLGRSEGCFALSKRNQWQVMQRLYGGRMIFADKVA